MESPNFVDSFVLPSLVVAVFVVGCTLLFSYIRKLFRIEHDAGEKNQSEQVSSTSERKKESSSGKPKKKQTWTRSADRQNFSSPWLLKTLKNHTGQVLNIDYSSSGKYLASCGEEDPDPDPYMNSSSGSESNKENSRPPSAASSPRKNGLSRRQRKNRKMIRGRADKPMEILGEYKRMNLTKEQFEMLLRPFVLTHDGLERAGYPYANPYCNKSVFFRNYQWNKYRNVNRTFDVNAREFVPASQDSAIVYTGSPETNSESSDSAWSSGSESDLTRYGDEKCLEEPGVQRTCVRCNRGFFTTNKEYLTEEKCTYHWGRLQNSADNYNVRVYSCCQEEASVAGCETCYRHVWNGSVDGLNGPFYGFVKTRKNYSRPSEPYHGVYALDCEMCYTVAGLEVTKVTVVGIDGIPVYNTFVKPRNPIIDYNTRFSGITSKDLQFGWKRLKQVQRDLLKFISGDTILIGHSLENDLRALKILHDTVVDTSICFPHENGLPFKRSLKSLAQCILRKEVQCGSEGHDSLEDARACMELMLRRVRMGYTMDCRSYMRV